MADAIDRLIELDGLESRKQLERTAWQAMNEAVLEALPDALIVIDAAGRIVLFNRQAELMFGYHRAEMIGQSVEMLIPERDRTRHAHDREGYNRFAITERSRTMGIGPNLTAIRKDGHEFHVDITLARTVVPAGIYSLALVRFARNIVDQVVAQRPYQTSADTQCKADAGDAGH